MMIILILIIIILYVLPWRSWQVFWLLNVLQRRVIYISESNRHFLF